MKDLFTIDATSFLLTVATELSLEEIEDRLADKGFTLHYFAPPDNRISLAQALMERLPNLYASTYGGIEASCVALSLRQKDGKIYSNVLAPRSATGPCLKKLAIGSGGALGHPVRATLRIFKRPAARSVVLLRFSSPEKLERFSISLKRLRWTCPLLGELPREGSAKLGMRETKGEVLLGLVLWGEKEILIAQEDFLRAMTEQNDGNWVELETEEDREKVLLFLQTALGRRMLVPRAGEFSDHEKVLAILEAAT